MAKLSAKTRLMNKAQEMLDGPLSLEKAILIALLAHAGGEDKGRNSYILHPLRVMQAIDGNEDARAVAVCHDVPEDTDITLDDLEELGFTKTQIKTLDALTKRPGEAYRDAIARVKQSHTASEIKVEDLRDNLAWWRIKNPKLSEADFVRIQNYIDALDALGALYKRKG